MIILAVALAVISSLSSASTVYVSEMENDIVKAVQIGAYRYALSIEGKVFSIKSDEQTELQGMGLFFNEISINDVNGNIRLYALDQYGEIYQWNEADNIWYQRLVGHSFFNGIQADPTGMLYAIRNGKVFVIDPDEETISVRDLPDTAPEGDVIDVAISSLDVNSNYDVVVRQETLRQEVVVAVEDEVTEEENQNQGLSQAHQEIVYVTDEIIYYNLVNQEFSEIRRDSY